MIWGTINNLLYYYYHYMFSRVFSPWTQKRTLILNSKKNRTSGNCLFNTDLQNGGSSGCLGFWGVPQSLTCITAVANFSAAGGVRLQEVGAFVLKQVLSVMEFKGAVLPSLFSAPTILFYSLHDTSFKAYVLSVCKMCRRFPNNELHNLQKL